MLQFRFLDTLDVQQVKKSTRPGQGNCYVRLNSDEPKHAPPSYCNVSLPPEQNDIAPSTSSPGDSLDRRAAPGFHDAGARVQVPPSLLNQTAVRIPVSSHSNVTFSLCQ